MNEENTLPPLPTVNPGTWPTQQVKPEPVYIESNPDDTQTNQVYYYPSPREL